MELFSVYRHLVNCDSDHHCHLKSNFQDGLADRLVRGCVPPNLRRGAVHPFLWLRRAKLDIRQQLPDPSTSWRGTRGQAQLPRLASSGDKISRAPVLAHAVREVSAHRKRRVSENPAGILKKKIKVWIALGLRKPGNRQHLTSGIRMFFETPKTFVDEDHYDKDKFRFCQLSSLTASIAFKRYFYTKLLMAIHFSISPHTAFKMNILIQSRAASVWTGLMAITFLLFLSFRPTRVVSKLTFHRPVQTAVPLECSAEHSENSSRTPIGTEASFMLTIFRSGHLETKLLRYRRNVRLRVCVRHAGMDFLQFELMDKWSHNAISDVEQTILLYSIYLLTLWLNWSKSMHYSGSIFEWCTFVHM